MEKLYDITFTFDPKDYSGEVKSVALRGEFLFYKSGLTGHTDKTSMEDCDKKYPPNQYKEGLNHIGDLYYEDMKKNEQGIYEVTLRLPAGVYPYHFLINPKLTEPATIAPYSWSNMTLSDGSQRALEDREAAFACHFTGPNNHVMADPKNPSISPTVTSGQMNSELYVGTDEESICLPISDKSKAGVISYLSYFDVDDKVQSLAIYLPANYDKDKTYPLILTSHGGEGNEGDWHNQGTINNIMDHLIDQKKTRPAIIACMNNSVYDWDFPKIARNCEERVVPFLEKLFHISPNVKDRAFCGLSFGSVTTLYMYLHCNRSYQYFGAFSGGFPKEYRLDDPHLKDVKLMIGSAEEDFAYAGVRKALNALDANGLPYVPYFVTGSHSWFCWTQMFQYFAETVLWK